MGSMDIAHQRLHNQHLVGASFTHPKEAVRQLGPIQAQDYAGAKWAIAQRTDGMTDAALDRMFADGDILRTHLMRPTWHFVAPEDIRWVLELTAPRVHAANAYYYRQSGLDEPLLMRTNALLAGALQGGEHLTRAELTGVLKDAGIVASGLKLAYIVMRAELDKVICSGARRGKQFTYALLDERVPEAKDLEREEALAELVTRYFTSHGPALIQDFVWWSGLTVADTKRGLEIARSSLEDKTIDGQTYWFNRSMDEAGENVLTVHLLPNYDEYFSYKDRSSLFDPSRFDSGSALNGVLDAHIVVVNGRVVGGWRRTIKGSEITLEADLPRGLSESETEALRTACDRYGRFMDKPVTLVSN